MELKAIPASFKQTSKGVIEGHAAVFGNKDSYGDIIQPGAFARTLANDRGRVKVLWQHDPTEPIGKPLEMREDDRGLHVTARIAPTRRGQDALVLFDAEIIEELSIGYDAIVEEFDNDKGARLLREIRLWEFSPVTWAANELARITSVKQASDLDMVLDRLERIQWAKGRLESPRLREKAEGAIRHLEALLNGDTNPDQLVAAPSGTPPTPDTGPDPVHAVLDSLSALKTRALATRTAHELRAFGETLRRND